METKMVHKFAFMLQKMFPDWYTKSGGFWDVFVPYIWDNKWLQSKVTYKIITGTEPIDIRTVFKDSEMVKLQAEKICEGITDQDKKARAIWQWVKKNIKYISDTKKHGKPEYWQYPEQTMLFKSGDCEDGAVLMCKMMEYVGIYHVKVAAGWVKNPNGNKDVGHAYCIYNKYKTDKWVIADWCYYPTQMRVWETAKEYKEIWWTVNSRLAWAQHDVIVKEGKLYD